MISKILTANTDNSSQVPTALQAFTSLSIPFVLLMLLMRVYEYIAVSIMHNLPSQHLGLFAQGLVYDLLFALGISAVLALPFIALYQYKAKWAKVFYYVSAGLVLVGQLSLVNFFIVSFMPLGAEVWGYTNEEIGTTLKASAAGGFSVLPILPYVALAGLWFLAPKLSRKIKLPFNVQTGFLGLAVAALFVGGFIHAKEQNFNVDAQYFLATNKSTHFLSKLFDSQLATTAKYQVIDSNEYPLLHKDTSPDVLGQYFNTNKEAPNLVFVIVESLSTAFCGDNANYKSFTPFIDELANESLYWENFISCTGRTYGILSSMFGSLPYADRGFLEMGHNMPHHHTMMSLLKNNGYQTNFYYGGPGTFDKKHIFLERQKLDYKQSSTYFDRTGNYSKMMGNEKGFTWGYGDKDVFKESFKVMDKRNNTQPKMDTYLTLTMHEPFLFDEQEIYYEKFEARLKELNIPAEDKEKYEKYRQQYAAIMYTDDAIKDLIATYKKRPEFENTIFVITGDHRMGVIPQVTKIDRYRVPFMVYSPMLKKAARFKSVSTHADVTPSFLAFLKNNYPLNFPEQVHWLGDGLDVATEFRNTNSIALMRNKSELIDYLDGEYYLAANQLFKLRPNLNLAPYNDGVIKNKLQKKLNDFKSINNYVCHNDKLLPHELIQHKFVKKTKLNIYDTLEVEQLFALAKEKSIQDNRDEAREICNYILTELPDYHDVRTLLGRTHSWDKNYGQARKEFKQVITKLPTYEDAYIALMDVELWSKNPKDALVVAEDGLTYLPNSEGIKMRQQKALNLLARLEKTPTLASVPKVVVATGIPEYTHINSLINSRLNTDELFELARQLAFNGKREDARAVCQHILKTAPNYHDVRILMARTYAWDKQHNNARQALNYVLHNKPNYKDAASALIDTEIWSNHLAAAVDVADKMIRYYPADENLLLKKAKALTKMNRYTEAIEVLDCLHEINPNNEKEKQLRKQLIKAT